MAASALAAIASIGAAVGAVLVGYQILIVGAACTLCIASAVVSRVIAGRALIEARERRLGRSSPKEGGEVGHGPRNHGRDVALIARGHAGLVAAADDCRATGRRGLAIPLDVIGRRWLVACPPRADIAAA